MLSSRSTNALFAPDGEGALSSSTRHLNFKTPARSIKHGRAVHDENAVYGHPKTAGFTGRKKASTLFSTPASNLLQPRLKTDKVSRTASKSTALLEITNQTPSHKAQFPVTPGRASSKSSKLFTVLNDASAGPSTRRVSSTRKKLRLPRSATKSFQTPDTQGNHWDVSDVSIEASVIEEVSIVEEDYDDVEYGPPTAIEPAYEPPFDMPNYKEVGETLMSMLRHSTFPEDYDPVLESDNAGLLAEDAQLEWENIELPDIPLENIFPSMVQSNTPHASEFGKRPQSETICSKPTAMSVSVASKEPFKSSMRIPSLIDRRLNNVPAKSILKPIQQKVSISSHTRIPSLSRPVATSIPPPALKDRNRTSLHSKTASVPHLRAINTLQARTTGTTRVGHSRATSTTTMAHSRTTSVSKPVSTSKGTLGIGSRTPKVPDDTVHSLLTGGGEEVLGDEFLFTI